MISKKLKIFLVSLIITVIAFICIESIMIKVNSVPYAEAVRFIKSDSAIRNKFGTIKDLGIPFGDLNSPKGHSYFKIKVKGVLKTEKMGIKLEEGRYGNWKVVSWKIL